MWFKKKFFGLNYSNLTKTASSWAEFTQIWLKKEKFWTSLTQIRPKMTHSEKSRYKLSKIHVWWRNQSKHKHLITHPRSKNLFNYIHFLLLSWTWNHNIFTHTQKKQTRDTHRENIKWHTFLNEIEKVSNFIRNTKLRCS